MRKVLDVPSDKVVGWDDWFAAHKAHLEKEKSFTRQRELLAAERRALPWMMIDKPMSLKRPKEKRC